MGIRPASQEPHGDPFIHCVSKSVYGPKCVKMPKAWTTKEMCQPSMWEVGVAESVLDVRWVGTERWVRFCGSWLLAHVCQSEHRMSTSSGTRQYRCWWHHWPTFVPPFPIDLSFVFQDLVKSHHILPRKDLRCGHYMFFQRLIIEAWSLIGDPNHCEAVMKALIHWVRHNLMVWYRGDGDFERWGLVVGRRSLGHDLGASFT